MNNVLGLAAFDEMETRILFSDKKTDCLALLSLMHVQC